MRGVTRRTFLAAATTTAAVAAGKRIRTGVLGVQHSHFRGKLAALRANPKFEVVAFSEADRATRERARARFTAPEDRATPWVTPEALLSDDSLDLIVFEGEVHDAIPAARRILAAGKHLHLEKPPSDRMAPFREVVELARGNGLALQVGYVWRRHAGIEAALDAYRAGWLGRVFMIRATVHADRDAPQRAIEARYPGGSMFEMGGHVLDRIVAFLGRPREVRHWLRHDSTVDDDLADNTLAVLEYENALAIVAAASKMAGSGGHRSFEVIGEDGTFSIQPLEPKPVMRVYLREAAGPYRAGWQEIELPEQPRYGRDLEDLAAAILEGRPPRASYDHELLVQETLLRASGLH